MGTGKLYAGEKACDGLATHPEAGEGGRGISIHLVTLCYKHRDKLRTDGPLGLYADLILLLYYICQGVSIHLIFDFQGIIRNRTGTL